MDPVTVRDLGLDRTMVDTLFAMMNPGVILVAFAFFVSILAVVALVRPMRSKRRPKRLPDRRAPRDYAPTARSQEEYWR